MNRQPSLYDPSEGSAPLPEQYQMVEPGSVRRAFWAGMATAGGIVATIAALAWSLPALAAPQCDSIERVTALLADKYGETLRSTGLAGEGAVISLWASDATGTWTITLTMDDGQMCLMSSGVNFTVVPAGDPA